MKNPSQTRPTKEAQKHEMVRATAAQLARQALLIVVVLALWAGLLVVYLSLTGRPELPVSEAPQPTEVVAAPEPTQVPTSTEQLATATHAVPAPTETSTATSGPTELPTEPSEATSSPTQLPTETEVPPSPTVLPTETETPPSPTDVPTNIPTPPVAASVSFSEDVLPILTSRCRRCHGGDGIEAGLDLLSYAGVMAGSENGPVVIPGDSATSSLVQLLLDGEMPRRAPSLPSSEIETIATWVDEGALEN